MQNTATKAATSFWPIVFPLALAQFVCSYAATTMNVSISSIATDLGTDVHAIQITITFFTLTMAALMIPGSKLTDSWGRKFCLTLGLIVYGLGALIATFAQSIAILVLGILQSGTYGLVTASQNFTIGTAVIIPQVGISPVWLFVGIGALFLLAFFLWFRSRERAGKEPLLHTRMFRNRTSNLGLVTQLVQWLILQGSFFVFSVFLQQELNFTAIQTGLALTPTTIGILITGSIAGRHAQSFTQKTLIWSFIDCPYLFTHTSFPDYHCYRC